MNQETDNLLNEFEQVPAIYGTFWDRLLALIIDGIVLLPLFVSDWLNKTSWKSTPLLIISFIIGLLYKPYCEFKFGATIGKKAMKLLVVNKEFLKVNLKEVLIRNIFDIIWRVFIFITVLMVFSNAAFSEVSTDEEFNSLQNEIFNTVPYIIAFTALELIEVIFLVTDKQKRALHDRMGETLVIKITR